MLNDFKEDDKIISETEVNIPKNEIQVLSFDDEFFFYVTIYAYLPSSKFVSVC